MAVEHGVVPAIIAVPATHPTTVGEIAVVVVAVGLRCCPSRIDVRRVGIDVGTHVELDDVITQRIDTDFLETAAELPTTVVFIDVARRTGVVRRPFRNILDRGALRLYRLLRSNEVEVVVLSHHRQWHRSSEDE